MLEWNYLGECEPERRAALCEQRSFPEIVEEVVHKMKPLCFHRQDRTNNRSYSRAVYYTEIKPTLFYAFFNSQRGYRGEYFISPAAGLEANRLLLSLVSPKLISWTKKHYSDVDEDWLIETLSLPSAKAWLAEPNGICDVCRAGEWSALYHSELHIANGRWEKSKHLHAAWGRQAPRLSKVKFFGGFVNCTRHEWVADHKLQRAKHIWGYGWS